MERGGCPYAAAAAAAALSKEDHAATSKGVCPMASRLQADADGGAAPAAVCPLGFGTARGPKLTVLHCPVCRGLLFNAHMVSGCQHTFCEACISRTRDCPTCGADVEGLEANAELAGLVDTFLDTHSRSPELVAAQADLGPLPDNSAASFFMAQGLKSLAGGNVHAALHRLGRCRQALLDEPAAPTPAAAAAAAAAAAEAAAEAAGGSDVQAPGGHDQQHGAQQQPAVANKAVQLATVCGCLGDCYQRLGQAGQAEQLYRESVAAVQPLSEANAEAAHAMSVSLNKLGDARYRAQQLHAAKQLYREALQLRQRCCGPLTSGQAGPAQQLELAASLVKVADVCRALEEVAEGDQLLRRAHGVCCEVQSLGEDALSPAAARKLQLLLELLQGQGHGGGAA